MKIGFSLAVLLAISGFLPTVHAEDVKLKASCIRANPIVDGEVDPLLRGIYAQLCDKKNKEYQLFYLVKAAQRFQQIGQNYKALHIVAELEKGNVQSITLTDVKLIASTEIATSALTQLKDVEKRRLTMGDTYLSVKKNSDLSRVAEIQPLFNSKKNSKKARKSVRHTKKVVSSVSNSKSETKLVQKKSSSNPFAGL